MNAHVNLSADRAIAPLPLSGQELVLHLFSGYYVVPSPTYFSSSHEEPHMEETILKAL